MTAPVSPGPAGLELAGLELAGEDAAPVLIQGCQGCGACLLTCPERALVPHGSTLRVRAGRCTGCGECLEVCPVDAIAFRVPPPAPLPPGRPVPPAGAHGPTRAGGGPHGAGSCPS